MEVFKGEWVELSVTKWVKLQLNPKSHLQSDTTYDQYVYVNVNYIQSINPAGYRIVMNGGLDYRITKDSMATLIRAIGFKGAM